MPGPNGLGSVVRIAPRLAGPAVVLGQSPESTVEIPQQLLRLGGGERRRGGLGIVERCRDPSEEVVLEGQFERLDRTTEEGGRRAPLGGLVDSAGGLARVGPEGRGVGRLHQVAEPSAPKARAAGQELVEGE